MTNEQTASQKVSAEINSIRSANGWDGKTCTTCCRDVHSPYRVYSERGIVLQGCIDSSHEGRSIAESSRWHNRTESKAMRRDTRNKLRAYGKK